MISETVRALTKDQHTLKDILITRKSFFVNFISVLRKLDINLKNSFFPESDSKVFQKKTKSRDKLNILLGKEKDNFKLWLQKQSALCEGHRTNESCMICTLPEIRYLKSSIITPIN